MSERAATAAGRTWRSLLGLVMSFALMGGTPALLADDQDAVLARVDGQTVTKAEIMKLLAGEFMKLERQRHEMIENAVNGRVQELLTEREAQRRGMTPEELMKAEVEEKALAVPADEVDDFYKARQLRQPKDQVASQIRQYLAFQKFIDGLKAKAKVEVLTEPYRVAVEAEGPFKGKKGAPVTIVEFGDFECPPCGRAYSVVKKIHENYGDKVQVVFRQFPLRSIHPNAQKAGEASLCAGDQNRFWEMHDKMFENQRNLSVDGLKSMATEIAGLDTGAFNQCLDGGKHADLVEEDMQAGVRAGVSGTPAFFVNGRVIPGVPSYETLAQVVEDELSRQKSSGP